MLVRGLPSGSAFWAAIADDDEAAREYLDQGDNRTSGSGAPALTEMSFQNQLLMELVDGMTAVVARLDVIRGVGSVRMKPLPRPLTALDRARARVEDEEISSLILEVEAAMAKWEELDTDGRQG